MAKTQRLIHNFFLRYLLESILPILAMDYSGFSAAINDSNGKESPRGSSPAKTDGKAEKPRR